jgi:hypothetical protein
MLMKCCAFCSVTAPLIATAFSWALLSDTGRVKGQKGTISGRGENHGHPQTVMLAKNEVASSRSSAVARWAGVYWLS